MMHNTRLLLAAVLCLLVFLTLTHAVPHPGGNASPYLNRKLLTDMNHHDGDHGGDDDHGKWENNIWHDKDDDKGHWNDIWHGHKGWDRNSWDRGWFNNWNNDWNNKWFSGWNNKWSDGWNNKWDHGGRKDHWP